jgi:hypothetical protein
MPLPIVEPSVVADFEEAQALSANDNRSTWTVRFMVAEASTALGAGPTITATVL